MRCPSCEKFVSYDTEVEPEEESAPEISGTQVTATYRRVLNCAECGEELKDATIEFDVELELAEGVTEICGGTEEDADEEDASGVPADTEHEWELEGDADVSATERTQTHDRHGKVIKNRRYAKTYYGVDFSGEAKCVRCGAKATFSASNDEQASSFNELT